MTFDPLFKKRATVDGSSMGYQRELAIGWENQTVVTAPWTHLIQEDSGEPIGEAIAVWMTGL
jgi:hypothetical protein